MTDTDAIWKPCHASFTVQVVFIKVDRLWVSYAVSGYVLVFGECDGARTGSGTKPQQTEVFPLNAKELAQLTLRSLRS